MWRACGLPLLGPCLRPDPGIRRLGAWSLSPLIYIRGPNLDHPLLMILSSAAMVCSWPGLAWDTSIVNFFIFFLYYFSLVIALFYFFSDMLQINFIGLNGIIYFPPTAFSQVAPYIVWESTSWTSLNPFEHCPIAGAVRILLSRHRQRLRILALWPLLRWIYFGW